MLIYFFIFVYNTKYNTHEIIYSNINVRQHDTIQLIIQFSEDFDHFTLAFIQQIMTIFEYTIKKVFHLKKIFPGSFRIAQHSSSAGSHPTETETATDNENGEPVSIFFIF